MNRLSYCPVSWAHIDVMAQLWAAPEVIRYTAVETPCSPGQSRLRLEALLQGQEGLPFPTLYLVSCNEEACGVVGCPPIGRDRKKFGLFYQFLPQFWGKGIGEEAVAWLVNQMRGRYPKASLFADVVEQNTASLRIMEKLGFEQGCARKGAFERDGKQLDILPFQLLLERGCGNGRFEL